MKESLCIDSPLWGQPMAKAYSCDLRERVIEAVEMGASRREAAERFELSVSSAVRWLQRWRDERSAAPKPRGGSTSPLEEFATATECGTAGSHFGGDRCRVAQAADSNQLYLALAVFRSTQHH